MNGLTHASTSGCLAAAVAVSAGVDDPQARIAWVVVCAGAGYIPDLDMGSVHLTWRRRRGQMLGHPRLACHGSTVSVMWGPVTAGLGQVIGRAARGHRWGTHDAVLAPPLFAAVTWLACLTTVGETLVTALLAGLALRAFHFAIPGRMELSAVGNAAMSFGFAVCFHDALPEWTPLGVAFGVLAHQLGDLLTPEGLPVPVAWTWRRHATPSSARVKLPSWTVRVLWRQVTFGPMRTGGPLERWVIAPAAVAGMAVLVCHGATLPPLPA